MYAAKSQSAVQAPGLGPPLPSDPRLVYELREQCGRDAQSWYHHYFEENKNTTPGAYPMKTKLTKLGTGNALTDVLENKELGEFYKFSDMTKPMICYVGENKCDSQEGFDALVAPFMDE